MASHVDHGLATRPERFFWRFLTHVKGELAGMPIVLEAWQQKIVRPLFGTIREDGLRQYRTCYLEVPRKNGKSTLGAALAIYLLFADGEPGGEIYSAAADRFQAAIVFDVAKQMIEASPHLRRRCKIYKRSIAYGSSVYHVLSADAKTKHGVNPHGVIFDELHTQPNRELFDVLTSAGGSRRQPITFLITTAGFDRLSICYEQHELALDILDPENEFDDQTFLPVIYGAADVVEKDPEAWKDPATWELANPNLGVSVKPDFLESECVKATRSPARQNTFLRLYLNVWTEQDVRWLPMDKWDACGRLEALELEDLAGRECYVGLDLASKIDIAALVFLFPPVEEGERVKVVPMFFCPEESVTRRSLSEGVTYDVWSARGLIEATPGSRIDYGYIRNRILEAHEIVNILEIAYDRWNADQLVQDLLGDGLELVPFGQGFRDMSAPSKELEAMLAAEELEHAGHPVLRWMAKNVAADQDPAGNIKPSRKKSKEKIDGIVGLLEALGRWIVQPDEPPSRYDTEGIDVI